MIKVWCIVWMLLLLVVTLISAVAITHLTYTHHGDREDDVLVGSATFLC